LEANRDYTIIEGPFPGMKSMLVERKVDEIPGLTQMTSASALGYVQITLQFELSRQIDGAVSTGRSRTGSGARPFIQSRVQPPVGRFSQK
jgi:multidrug efflux pump subunit AcrB